MEIIPALKQFGLSDKEIKVYLALLNYGPCSVRMLAQLAKINRGTTYDILKSLQKEGLVSYYHKATKQFFVAEDPSLLYGALEKRMNALENVKKDFGRIIPELKSLFNNADKPVVTFYEGFSGVKTVLADVLEVMALQKEKLYYVFSSKDIRNYLHTASPRFTQQRIAKKINVKVIALGHQGTVAKFSERKSLSGKKSFPTYILIYAGKVAMISVNAQKQPLALIIKDPALFATERQLFEFMWESL